MFLLKKPLLYSAFFLIFLLFNLVIVVKLHAYHNRQLYASTILKEIEQDNSLADQFNSSNAPYNTDTYKGEAKLADGRVANLKAFFRRHNSPLFDFADVFVKNADQYGFDYRLLPAIAMQESNLCRAIPENSFNCWGWGIYGSTVTRFESYEEAINTVSKGIKKDYLDKGLITASAIMQKYTPSSNGSWAHGVNFFLQALE